MDYISIVVPFYNTEKFIEECIQGLLAQTYRQEKYEIIMVDNNSTDDSARIVNKYSRIRLFSEVEQGAYAARNRGIREARGSIIAFTDPDCKPAKNWLNAICIAMMQINCVIVLGNYASPRALFPLGFVTDYVNERARYVLNSKKEELYYGYTNNMAARKTLFDQNGLFYRRPRGADTLFVQSAIKSDSCEIVHHSPEMLVEHLEIKNAGHLLYKSYIYSQSRQRYKHLASVTPLNFYERIRAFKNVSNLYNYSFIKTLICFGILSIGLCFWFYGSVTGWISFKKYGDSVEG